MCKKYFKIKLSLQILTIQFVLFNLAIQFLSFNFAIKSNCFDVFLDQDLAFKAKLTIYYYLKTY